MRASIKGLLWLVAATILVSTVALTFTRAVAGPAVVQTVALHPAVQSAPAVAGAAGTFHISYQGRLLDALSGQPKADGAYTIAFRLYAVESGGAALWTESKSVPVNKGLFSTLLGDTTALDLAIFNGQDLFLGITVGTDPEATPRQRVAHVAYAIFAANADTLDGKDGSAFAPAVHLHDGSTIVDDALDAADIANDAVTNAELADNAVFSANIRDLQVTTADLADGAVNGAKLVDESITAADIQNRSRNITLPANAINYDDDSTIIDATATGLLWQSTFSNPAFLNLPRPADWDGSSNVVLRLYFQVTTPSAGVVEWFIRPRAFAAGDNFIDVGSQNPDSVTTVLSNSSQKIFEQTFTIPATRFGSKALWVISLQRQGSNETYRDDVILHAVDLTYTAVQ